MNDATALAASSADRLAKPKLDPAPSTTEVPAPKTDREHELLEQPDARERRMTPERDGVRHRPETGQHDQARRRDARPTARRPKQATP